MCLDGGETLENCIAFCYVILGVGEGRNFENVQTDPRTVSGTQTYTTRRRFTHRNHSPLPARNHSLEIRRDRLLQIDAERRRVAAVDERSHRHRDATVGQPAPGATHQAQRQRTVDCCLRTDIERAFSVLVRKSANICAHSGLPPLRLRTSPRNQIVAALSHSPASASRCAAASAAAGRRCADAHASAIGRRPQCRCRSVST